MLLEFKMVISSGLNEQGIGHTGHHYRDGYAYKYEDDLYETVLRDVIWNTSRSGMLAPVAVFDPVEIEGNADRVVVTTKEDVSAVLKEELENGHGVDVAIDCLGGEIMGKCIHYLTHGARWIMIAALAGQKTEIDLKNIYVRNVRIIGSTLRSRTPQVKAQILAELIKNVFPKIESGEVKPTIYKTLPITEAEAAHDILYKGQNIGKVVLKVK